MRCDPVENTAKYRLIERELEQKIVAKIGKRKMFGFCHLYWMTKKKILREEYGIEWSSPAELNPHIHFD